MDVGAYVGILLITILISFTTVRIGAFALHLTGLEPEAATFQALSAFSGTGFTTAESERVVRHRSRRRIISILIILGNAGLVAVIGTLAAGATQAQNLGWEWVLIYMGVVILGIFVLYRVVLKSGLATSLIEKLRKPLLKRIVMAAPPFEEMMHVGGDWSVNLVTIGKNSKFIDRTLSDLMSLSDVDVLAIDRTDSFTSRPTDDVVIREKDRLLVFCTTRSMKKLMGWTPQAQDAG